MGRTAKRETRYVLAENLNPKYYRLDDAGVYSKSQYKHMKVYWCKATKGYVSVLRNSEDRSLPSKIILSQFHPDLIASYSV